MESGRYEYRGEAGFVISIGKTSKIKVPWSMLEACFRQLSTPDGHNGTFFRQRYPLQARDHPCHVHAVGHMLVVAGVARRGGNTYRAVDT